MGCHSAAVDPLFPAAFAPAHHAASDLLVATALDVPFRTNPVRTLKFWLGLEPFYLNDKNNLRLKVSLSVKTS